MGSSLELSRPLVVLDLETTGTSVHTDRIVEIAVIQVSPDGSEKAFTTRLNPGVPIPQEATDVHGITDADVADCKPFSEVAKNLHAFLEGCDLAGYNAKRFDLPLLEQEFARVGIKFEWRNRAILDVYLIWTKSEPRRLEDAVRVFLGRDHKDAHGAEADAKATLDVLRAQVKKFDLPGNSKDLCEWSDPKDPDNYDEDGKLRWQGGELVLTFSKNKGRTLRDLVRSDRGFLDWMISRDFSPKIKEAISSAMSGRHPVRLR